jgi:hypothetical protein
MRFASFALASILLWQLAVADEYDDARAELIAAYQAQDYPEMVEAARRAVLARPDHPGAKFNLALAYALDGQLQQSIDVLDSLLAMGVEFGVDELDEFAAVREHVAWPAYATRLRHLREPEGGAVVFASLDDGNFVPEGIAFDDAGRLYLGSIRKGLLLRDGEVLSNRQGHWSVFGMRFHADGSLWFASAAVAQLEDVGEELGRTGLFRIDSDSGAITRAAILPQHSEQQVLGDLVVHGDAIFTTDSLTGAVYRYDIDDNEFTAIVPAGKFTSPQGLVVDSASGSVYVADYTRGIYRVPLDGGEPRKLGLPEGTSDYGIDGLYRYGDELVAIQNGIRPHRVVAFQLSGDGSAIAASRVLASNLPEFDEPTLGVIRGDDFYFVANSHWNRFDRDNRLPDDLVGPIVLKLALIRN